MIKNSQWTKYSDSTDKLSWVSYDKEIILSGKPYTIYIYKDSDMDYWIIDFIDGDELLNIYVDMFKDNCDKFYSEDLAKDHVDYFIEKLSKLKAFI
jgi:hypothetical protein